MPGTSQPDLQELVRLFYAAPENLARFEAVTAEQMPAVYRTLLAHQNHMTVTVEGFHHDVVDVEVLDRQKSPGSYARKILLRTRRGGRVIQFGIPRLKTACVSETVREQIESEKIPLGRVLIENGVLREVELTALWKVTPGPDLTRMLELPAPMVTYGRTALIRLNGEPAVELLEIVAPEEV